MTNHTADASIINIARIAGFAFLCNLIVPLFHWIFVLSKFIATDNVVDTAHNIMANEFLFRIGIVNELIISAVVVLLSFTLYTLLKPVNKNLALFAFLLKLLEAILWTVMALGLFIALLIINGQIDLTVFEQEQIQTLVGIFLNAHISLSAIPGVFCGLNLTIFSYLLYKSKYIPGILACFGVISYTFIFIYDLLTILSPKYLTITIVQIIGWGPSIVFEIVIGLWLLIKGVNIQRGNYRVPEST